MLGPEGLRYRFSTLGVFDLEMLVDSLIASTRTRDDGFPTEVHVLYPSAFWVGADARTLAQRYRDAGWVVEENTPTCLLLLRTPPRVRETVLL